MYLKRNNSLEFLKLYLGVYNKQFYLREISRLTKMPLKNVQNNVNSLEKSKIIKSSFRGKNKYFGLNLDNIQTKLYVLQAEIYRTLLFLEKYSLFKTFLKDISTQVPIIVFGSFAKCVVEDESDLDLLIVSKPEEKIPFYILPYNVHEIRLSNNSFMKSLEKQETLIKEIEENHVILNNHSFYIDTMWNYYAK